MNLTIDYRNAQGVVSQAAVAEVIAAAVRVGHSVTLTDRGRTRHTFSLDHRCVVVTGEHPDRAAIAPAEWANRIAATATRLLTPGSSGLSPGRSWPGDNSPRLSASPVARRRRRRPLTGS